MQSDMLRFVIKIAYAMVAMQALNFPALPGAN